MAEHKHVKVNKLGASGKEEQYWGAISKQKLDTLRYTILHSGLNVARLQNEDGLTGCMVAAKGGKDNALLLMLDTFRRQRIDKESVDVTDDEGRTALHYAAAAGQLKCVDHLIYYGASLTKKSEEGLDARGYAAKFKRAEVLSFLDGDDEEDEGEAAGGDAVDADGLTSTQRSRLKKKQMKEKERAGAIAAVSAAAAAADSAAEGIAALSVDGAPAAVVLGPFGLPPLPAAAPTPRWGELAVVNSEKRRECKVDKTGAAATASNPEPGVAPEDEFSGEASVDPALWHASHVNRLELRLPHLTVLSPLVGHLAALQTLILKGNGLSELPATLACLIELKHLDASDNKLVTLPDSLAKLPKLEVLDVAGNALTSLAPLAGLTSLLTLLADRNALTEVGPLSFAELGRLDTLSLSGNRLTSLPDEVRSAGWRTYERQGARGAEEPRGSRNQAHAGIILPTSCARL